MVSTCMNYLKQEDLVRNVELLTSYYQPENPGKIKRREEMPVHVSYQPPKILLTEKHLSDACTTLRDLQVRMIGWRQPRD